MSAYAALLSLDQLIGHPLFQCRFDDGRARDRLYRVVADLLLSLDHNRATQIQDLEKKITDAAYKSVDFIENHILNSGSLFSVIFNTNKTLICFVYTMGVLCILGASHLRRNEEYEYLMFLPTLILVIVPLAITAFSYGCLLEGVTESQRPCVTRAMYCFDDILIRISGARLIMENDCDPACAALDTLLSEVDSMLASRVRFRISQSEIAHFESLREMASSLLDFIGNASLNNTELQAIREAAYEARIALLHYPYGKLTLHRSLVLTYAWLAETNNFFVPDLLEMMNAVLNLPQEIYVCCIFLVQFVINFYWFLCVAGEQITDLLDKRYSEGTEIQELSQVIDDFGMVVRDVTENKDAFGSQSELPASSSKPDLGGSGRAGVVVGLDNDMMEIKSRMLQNWSKREIVSIVGMGGIGKTTLATQVYNDPEILRHFDIRAWVKVSQEYSLYRVLLSLLDSLLSQLDPDSAKKLRQEMQKHNDQELAVDLHQILMGRRYLIVMDDVWDTQIWDFMSIFYPENNNGSCVLLTSRLSDVASYPDSNSPLHQMQCLNEDDSRYLLNQMVFGAEGCPFELESIGKEIARGCRGLPLAISVVGGLIYLDNRIAIWKEVAEELKLSESREIKEQCLEILGLSYKHLPQHLRPCFLYMGVFSGDCEIPISRLLNLWIAEGFFGGFDPSSNLEEFGEGYLEALIDRNLIFVSKRSCTGKIKTCSIHDLLRDVCVLNAKEENFFHVLQSHEYGTRGRPDETTRRLSIHPNVLHNDARNDLMSSCPSLRSLLCIASKPITGCKIGVYLDFKFLRVLDILLVHFDEFPHQIIKLWFLRYLAFHYDGPFPASISKLKNLETIVHHHCLFGKYPLYPMVIWSMPNLRHIYVRPGYDWSHILWGFGSLVRLQTLVGVRNMKWSQSMVRRIINLKKLVISYDDSSSVDRSQYRLECLVELHQLESLKITMVTAISDDPPKLAFPQKLKKLSLSGCGIPWAEMAAIGALPKLEALKLRRDAFRGPSWETVEEGFPQLAFLLLEEMGFASWETDAAHFPRLQHLVIKSCGALEEFPYCVGDIPTLEMIELINCHPSAEDSAREMQEEQESMGNEELKLHIISWGSGNRQQQEGVDDFYAEEDSEETADKNEGND